MIKLDEKIATRKIVNKKLIKLMRFFSLLGNYNLIWLLTCMILYFIEESRISFYILASMLVIYAICSGFFKSLFRRERPYERFFDITPYIKEPYGSSFPSEHAAISAGVSYILLQYNVYFGLIACIISFLISISRVYLKVNYMSDVIIGIIIGILLSALIMHFGTTIFF